MMDFDDREKGYSAVIYIMESSNSVLFISEDLTILENVDTSHLTSWKILALNNY